MVQFLGFYRFLLLGLLGTIVLVSRSVVLLFHVQPHCCIGEVGALAEFAFEISA